MATNEDCHNSPDDWFYAGYGMGSSGKTLANCLYLVGREHGLVEEWVLAALIDGFHSGQSDLQRFAEDRSAGVDQEGIPF